MTDTGATLPGTGGVVGTGVVWTTPANITSSASYATSRSATGTSEKLIGTNFGFSISDTATIVGIKLMIKKYNTGGANASVVDNSVQLRKTTGAVGDSKAKAGIWAISGTEYDYGGATDLWGTTWTYTEINNSAFGAGLVTDKPHPDGDAYISHYLITVYYTVPSSAFLNLI